MFYFELYDDKRLNNKRAGEKWDTINLAIKLSRIQHPLNIRKRVALLFLLVLFPGAVIFYLFGSSWSVAWCTSITFIISVKQAQTETPLIKAFLDDAIRQKNTKT
ncbi:hypothetical protein [Neptunicella sp. SCSIO 80796]|uniref:hypothetical protein n=1 Tax=Neptunicella plasticusilytica TaxID=3117012 RepID=UPI003A4DE0F5